MASSWPPEPTYLLHGQIPLGSGLLFSSGTKKWPRVCVARLLQSSLLNLVVCTVVIQTSITQTETLRKPAISTTWTV
jgi:hypothetical protein